MKIEQQHIDLIRQKFASMQNKEDLVSLLSEAKNILYGKECKPFELRSITYYANPDLCKKRYSIFTIKKKSGGERIINAPVKGLKSILRSLNFVLQCMYEPHKAANGFVLNKSIVDNAKVHVGNYYVYNIDLKDFFHSFDRNRVKMAFLFEPFNLNGDREPLAFLLACLCTHPFEVNGEIINVLPQGSPTSPTITNILCKKMDRRLTGLAKRFGAKYTRYADDITFSSLHNIYNDNGDFKKELERIISEDNLLKINGNEKVIGLPLKINSDKTRLQKSAYRQEVTGLIVNEKVNVRKRYVKQIRMWLYYWEKYGYEKAQQIFTRDYITDKGHVKKGKPNLINVLDGKLKFLKMVKGEEDSTYKTLKRRFEKQFAKLSGKDERQKNEKGSLKNSHKPKETKNFLSLFNNSKGLKYLTHRFNDEKPDYKSFIELCRNEFEEAKQKYKDVPSPLIRRIEEFAFSENPEWFIRKGDKKISIRKGWSEKSFVEWYSKNNIHPSSDNKWNKEMILPFKETIEVRAGNLTKIIDEAITLALGDSKDNFTININIEELNSAEFYTDVDKFKQALFHIISTIKDRAEKNFCFEIKIMFNNQTLEGGDFKVITITHINSEATKKSNDPSFAKGDLKTIQNNLWGLCNYEIKAKFPDGKKKKIFLTDNYEDYKVIVKSNQSIDIESEVVEGFSHILKFY
ncbi:MAG TPA: reverse transcriptase family protein [Paludibacteraceae bacterium]|nr:reverse transcriptase family protein [Paludibacteraceae bacterium]